MNIKRLPNRDFEKRLVPELGSRIKTAREECGLSQKELAELLGLKSATAICLYESNKRSIDAIKLWQISQIVRVAILPPPLE